jgi:hypothetical protein
MGALVSLLARARMYLVIQTLVLSQEMVRVLWRDYQILPAIKMVQIDVFATTNETATMKS